MVISNLIYVEFDEQTENLIVQNFNGNSIYIVQNNLRDPIYNTERIVCCSCSEINVNKKSDSSSAKRCKKPEDGASSNWGFYWKLIKDLDYTVPHECARQQSRSASSFAWAVVLKRSCQVYNNISKTDIWSSQKK